MKTFIDGIFALLITGAGCAQTALMGSGVNSLADVSQAQWALIFCTSIIAAVKTMQSRLGSPQ